jgi:hypothetical protein
MKHYEQQCQRNSDNLREYVQSPELEGDMQRMEVAVKAIEAVAAAVKGRSNDEVRQTLFWILHQHVNAALVDTEPSFQWDFQRQQNFEMKMKIKKETE